MGLPQLGFGPGVRSVSPAFCFWMETLSLGVCLVLRVRVRVRVRIRVRVIVRLRPLLAIWPGRWICLGHGLALLLRDVAGGCARCSAGQETGT